MITIFMINEITKLVDSAKKVGVTFTPEYIDALYELDIKDITLLQDSYKLEVLTIKQKN